MKQTDIYLDLDGNLIPLDQLDAEERQLVARLRRRARTHPDWCDFDNYWTRAVAAFYDARGMSRKKSRQKAPYRIAQDLSGRLGIASGLVSPDDCEGDLAQLIRERFASREAFCKATGLDEEPLRQFLAGRGDLSITALEQGLERIGYSLRIRPVLVCAQGQKREQKQTG
jgi:hypothetical protein